MPDDFVTEALTALRRADADVVTGPQAAIGALLAFRRQQRRQRLRRVTAWGAIAAAAVLMASHWTAHETPHELVAASQPAATPAVPVIIQPRPSLERAVRKPAEPEEIVTAFFPLMDSPPPFEQGLLVRVTVPASTMRTVGLPVGDDYLSEPVQADVLVGQDDLARAIRFVSYRKVNRD
jgi:hypothetical protein